MGHSTIHFIIDHIDPLGQGVYKTEDKIYFIPKTLPGESGVARPIKVKKNIHFCQLISIENPSPERKKPECPHFLDCPACDFLHTSYESEIGFKAESFAKIIRNLPCDNFEIIKASQRLHYRNRIQLHYRKNSLELGHIDGRQNKIVSVPDCRILHPDLTAARDRIYADKKALLLKQRRPKGHVELYRKPLEQKTQESWNRPYAQGGFSQVNEEMNQKLKKTLQEKLGDVKDQIILDLFGGDGNLTRDFKDAKKIEHIDLYSSPINPTERENFYSLDLNDIGSLSEFYTIYQKTHAREDVDVLIVDPPRAGFKRLNDWVENFRPKRLAYISCHPATMAHDIQTINKQYSIEFAAMLDLFPSTHHFEAMLILDFDENTFYKV